MKTYTYPKASLLQLTCPRCGCEKPENGGYRVRKHRDVDGISEVKVMKVRCSRCLKHLRCIYPPGVLRYKWYSQKVEGIFAILDVHQVDEGCADELAEHLGYPVHAKTRTSWQATRAWRVSQLEQKQRRGKVKLASLDEFKVGQWWVYTLTDGYAQAIVDYAVCSSRNEEVVRDLIAEHEVEVFISDDRRESPWDGCSKIEAACDWFANTPHGRCWFHVVREVLSNFPKDERELAAEDLRFLYSRTELATAQWFLDILEKRYGPERLAPLTAAWEQLKLYWLVDTIPLTNNVSETLYNALWPRSRKRVIKALYRLLDWFKEARWRWNHHPIRGKTPWQRFTAHPSPPWLPSLLTSLGRKSYNFSR